MGVYSDLTDIELVSEVLQRYERATALNCYGCDSTELAGCTYAPIPRQNEITVGCGIGCLLPLTVAQRWDAYDGMSGIETVCNHYEDEYDHYFAYDQLETLVQLQRVHDTSLDIAQFRARLQRFIETKEWQSEWR